MIRPFIQARDMCGSLSIHRHHNTNNISIINMLSLACHIPLLLSTRTNEQVCYYHSRLVPLHTISDFIFKLALSGDYQSQSWSLFWLFFAPTMIENWCKGNYSSTYGDQSTSSPNQQCTWFFVCHSVKKQHRHLNLLFLVWQQSERVSVRLAARGTVPELQQQQQASSQDARYATATSPYYTHPNVYPTPTYSPQQLQPQLPQQLVVPETTQTLSESASSSTTTSSSKRQVPEDDSSSAPKAKRAKAKAKSGTPGSVPAIIAPGALNKSFCISSVFFLLSCEVSCFCPYLPFYRLSLAYMVYQAYTLGHFNFSLSLLTLFFLIFEGGFPSSFFIFLLLVTKMLD